MRVKYSTHLENRLVLRKIPRDLPLRIFEQADERFIDEETGNYIAVKRVEILGKERDMIVVYDQKGEEVEIITIHPLKESQKENRLQSGRWRKRPWNN